MLVEFAPSKINLTLEVLGRRSDGYHELASLVAFAVDAADRLEFNPSPEFDLEIDGPFASAIVGENLVGRAASALAGQNVQTGRIKLTKLLPVSSGIGGGSADAAAMLRLARRADPTQVERIPWSAIATQLGADVTACFVSRALYMTGAGETVKPIDAFPLLHAVLVNPLARVPADKTVRVFRAMSLKPGTMKAARVQPRMFGTPSEVLAFASERANEMTEAAQTVVPSIGQVLETLRGTPGCRLARLSGAGPTCFGLFDSSSDAREAADLIKAAQPSWWVVASRMR